MNTVMTPDHAGLALAHRIAECLPHRDGHAWTAAVYSAWWTTRPAARLTQSGRTGAVIVAVHPWRTEIAFQLDDREPYGPDLVTDRTAPQPVTREILRRVLPLLDDATAAAQGPRPADAAPVRLEHLRRVGAVLRAHGVEPAEGRGMLAHSSALDWRGASGARYWATLVGSNPAVDFMFRGPVRELEAVLPLFLDEPSGLPRRVRGVKSAVERRLAAHLTRFATVEPFAVTGLSIDTVKGPHGFAVSICAPGAPVTDDSPALAELHGVGADFLISLVPLLTR
ncbi:hypothetical protein AB0C52_12790 [Streptomyces sp. NPDC048717]|uniref:hypothetical protein n=1 Tax=Streptomyces sp. NPDC048717 TaxID=3154928 RepID=UPI0034414AD7